MLERSTKLVLKKLEDYTRYSATVETTKSFLDLEEKLKLTIQTSEEVEELGRKLEDDELCSSLVCFYNVFFITYSCTF